MLKNINYLIKYLLPPFVLDQISFIKALILQMKLKGVLKRNSKLQGKYLGQSVYVLGNGPSLNNFDLNKIYRHKVITMNHFELHPQKNDFEIVAHCIGEPYLSSTWEDPSPIITGLQADTYWFNADAVPYFSKKKIKNVYYYLPGLAANAMLLQGNNLTGVALQYQSTAQMAINIAIFFGFKKIYLLGFDHDWLVTRGHSPHFYEERDNVAKADLSKFAYIEMIRISLRLFETYIKLHNIAKKQDAQIWNLSEPSYLDVFPKLS